MSNFEKIKAMSIAELAEFLDKCGFEEHCVGHQCPPCSSCEDCCEMWLAKEGAEDAAHI